MRYFCSYASVNPEYSYSGGSTGRQPYSFHFNAAAYVHTHASLTIISHTRGIERLTVPLHHWQIHNSLAPPLRPGGIITLQSDRRQLG